MIVTEYFKTRSDGVVLVRTYSDKGNMIERDGILYEEAIDPETVGRVYTETDTEIQREDTSAEDELLVLEEKAAAYDILMGNEVAE